MTTAATTTSKTLEGLTVAVDVQHIYRDGQHRKDRGTLYELAGGATAWEAECALNYAHALADALRFFGARVIGNDPAHGVLIGPYSRRQAQAQALGATIYLACHLNAGGGSYALCEVREPLSLPLARSVLQALDEEIPEITTTTARMLEHGERGAVCIEGFTRGPAVLLEPLFGDNRAHQRLMTLEGLALIGQVVARGVMAWAARGQG